MKIFIDSADLNEIKEAFSWGIIDGVTTNPSLIKKALAGKNLKIDQYLQELLTLTRGFPVSLEIEGEENGQIREEQMLREARNLYHQLKLFNPAFNIKIPVNPTLNPTEKHAFESLKVIKTLTKEGIPINATLIMTPEQALLAAKAGARYLSPFLGRIDDYVQSGKENKGIKAGVELIQEIKAVLNHYSFHTEIIGASIRTIEHVRECAKVGVEISTIPFKIIKEMIAHEKTYEGVKKFQEDMVPEYREFLRK